MVGYIGRSPQIGGYHKLDAITTDGSASYTMQLNSGNFVPESANHLIVSVNGVIQAPVDSFTVSGSTITFASSLSASDTIDFIMALGNTLDIGVPSDSTVSLSKLTATGTKDATTFLRGDNTFAVPSYIDNTPMFFMYANSDTTCTAGSVTKITLGGTYYDTDSATSNSKFTVPSGKGGKYLIGGEISLGDTTNSVHMGIFVNGSHSYDSLNWWQDFGDALSGVSRTVVIDLSAGDYVELYCLVDGTTRGLNSEQSRTKLFGFRLGD